MLSFAHKCTHTHTHLWFDGAVDGWGAGGLHAPAAEGLGAGREGGVGDAVGHFVLQRWGALSVQLRSLLHLGQVTYHCHSQPVTQHNQSPHSTHCGYRSTTCTSVSHQKILPSLTTVMTHDKVCSDRFCGSFLLTCCDMS